MPTNVWRQIGLTEPIVAVFQSAMDALLTGLAPTLRIKAVSGPNENKYYQFSTGTWAATAADDGTMTEIDATDSPGEYELEWPIPTPDKRVNYIIRADGGATASPRYLYGNLYSQCFDFCGLGDLLDDEGLVGTISPCDYSHFIGRLLCKIRQITDEPNSRVKYTDTELLSYARSAWESALVDVNNNSDAVIVLRHDITVVGGTDDYILPPVVGEFLQFAKFGSNGVRQWEITPRSRWNPSGPGFTIEGHVLHLEPSWSQGETLRFDFIPSGAVEIHKGESTTYTATTLTLDTDPDAGALEKRPNGLAGSILRILSATWTGGGDFIQERVITNHDVATGVITFNPALNPTVASGTVTYEIVPVLYRLLEEVVAWYTASMILSIEGDTKRAQGIEKKYHEMIRALKLRLANLENRIGDRFESDTIHNRSFRPLIWGE